MYPALAQFPAACLTAGDRLALLVVGAGHLPSVVTAIYKSSHGQLEPCPSAANLMAQVRLPGKTLALKATNLVI